MTKILPKVDSNTPIRSALLDRGRQRFRRYAYAFQEYAGHKPAGRLLDFGAGGGGFLVAALESGLDAFGIEVDSVRQGQYLKIASNHQDRFCVYDGELLPFENNTFDSVYSWFVFEHVQNTWLALREIARVTRLGGFLEIHADDARNAWDGHAAIPWPPYMPRRFTRAYLSEFGKADRTTFINETVVYVTAPIIADMLQTLGFEVLRSEPSKVTPKPDGRYVRTDDDARILAQRVLAEWEQGVLKSPEQNLHVIARKQA